MRRMMLMVLLGVGCSGSDNQPDAGPADVYFADGAIDAGFAPDADLGFPEPDRDNDGVPDEVDNCPDQMNLLQENEDGDRFGDVCDPCPNSPHPPEAGADWCVVVVEQEPNDGWRAGQTVNLPEMNRAIEVIGNIEAATGTQAVDRFRLTVPEESLVHIVVRRQPQSPLQPLIIATGGLYRTPREADGEVQAERDLFFPSGGNYEILLTDRRGRSEAVGGQEYGYAATIERLPLPEDILDIDPRGGEQRRDVAFRRPGEVRIFTYDNIVYNWSIQANVSEGVDPILAFSGVFEGQSGFYNENSVIDGQSSNIRLDDALGVQLAGAAQRVIVDHSRTSPSPTVQLTIVPYASTPIEELEPNNNATTAISLRNRESVRGFIAFPTPDEDWYRYEWPAGSWVSIAGGHDNTAWVEVWHERPGGLVREFISLTGQHPRWIVPISGTYFVRIADTRNLQPPYQTFGEFYFIQAIALPVAYLGKNQPITTTTNIRTRLYDARPRLFRIPVEDQPLRIELTRTSSVPGVEPYMRLLGPDAKGIVGEGAMHIEAVLQPANFPYYLAVHDARRMGSSGELIDFSIDVVLTPQE